MIPVVAQTTENPKAANTDAKPSWRVYALPDHMQADLDFIKNPHGNDGKGSRRLPHWVQDIASAVATLVLVGGSFFVPYSIYRNNQEAKLSPIQRENELSISSLPPKPFKTRRKRKRSQLQWCSSYRSCLWAGGVQQRRATFLRSTIPAIAWTNYWSGHSHSSRAKPFRKAVGPKGTRSGNTFSGIAAAMVKDCTDLPDGKIISGETGPRFGPENPSLKKSSGKGRLRHLRSRLRTSFRNYRRHGFGARTQVFLALLGIGGRRCPAFGLKKDSQMANALSAGMKTTLTA